MSSPLNSDLQKLLLSVERKEKAAKKRVILFSIFPLLLALALLFYIASEVKERTAALSKINKQVAQKSKQIKALNDSLFLLGKTALNGFGYSKAQLSGISAKQIKTSLDANAHIMQFLQGHKISPGIDIRYFPKGADQDKIIVALKEQGFNPIIIPARETMKTVPTNAIWYGNQANLDDVKLVAMYLIRAGIALKSIKPFDQPNGPKRNAIEIGAGKKYVNDPPYTVEKILESHHFRELMMQTKAE